METPNWAVTIRPNIVHWLIDEFKNDQGIDLSGDAMAMQRLEEEA